MRPIPVLALLLSAATPRGAPTQAAEATTPARVEEGAVAPSAIAQGDALTVSYRVSGGGKQLSATAFVRTGAIESAPEAWHEGAVRFEPKYQIARQDLQGKSKHVRCTLPGRATKGLTPGPHTVFVAFSDPPQGWEIVKIGEVRVAAWDRIRTPTRPSGPQAAIWKDAVQPVGTGSSPDRLAELVRRAGCSATFLSSDRLADTTTLNREAFDLLVLPYGAAIPGPAVKRVAQFLREAGALLCTGGVPLTCPVPTPSATRSAQPCRLLADMEGVAAVEALDVEHGPRTDGSTARVAPGAAGTEYALRLTVPELNDWFYVRVPLQETGRSEQSVIRFWARGDEATDRLCLELNEADGSRWKYFVKLTPEWRQHTAWMTDFACYASPARGGPGDRVRPGEVVCLKLGFYRALFDEQHPRIVRLDQVERCAGAQRRPDERLRHWQEWRKQYAYLKAVPPAPELDLLQDVRRTADVVSLRAAAGQHAIDPGLRVQGSFSGFDVDPVTRRAADPAWHMGPGPSARWVPLLEGYTADDDRAGVLAGLLLSYRGPYRGARCAFFCVDSEDLFPGDQPAMERVFIDTVRALTQLPFLCDVEPSFSVEDGRLQETWRAGVVNASGRGQHLAVEMHPVGGDAVRTAAVQLSPGDVRGVSVAFDSSDLDLKCLGVRVVLRRDGRAIDELRVEADALAGLTAAGDWLLANQQAAGNFSRIYYGDVYGARALLVLGRLAGKTIYTDAAIRMADMMVRDQRSDGGWWVGYGPARDCVFVADDGCIALGLVQMAAQVDAARRKAYLDAARRFVGFREGFRITGQAAQELAAQYGPDHPGILRGGLGIGYVRNDYFADAPYPTAHREMRQRPWTLHCSLPFLGGLCRLDESERHRALAVQDTRWFLERCEAGEDKVTGGYANEAAVWMLDTLDDTELQDRLERELTDHFLPYVSDQSRTWWTAAGGRGALLLPGLVYCSRELTPGPTAEAALARVVWSLCADASPLSLCRITERFPATTNTEVVMYVCFSSVGLAELLEPRSTMLPR